MKCAFNHAEGQHSLKCEFFARADRDDRRNHYALRAAAKRRTEQNRVNRGNWSNNCRGTYGRTEVAFPAPVSS